MDENDILGKIYNKVEKISDDMGELKVTSAKQQVSLDEHVRRTDLLEKQTEILFSEIKPLKEHVIQVSGIFKFLAGLSTVFGVIFGALKLIKKI